MDDDKIKQLFQDFRPGMSSDFAFLSKLERNLNSVEIIRQQAAQVHRRSRKAVIIAAIVGFVTGFFASYLVPYIGGLISDIQSSLPDSSTLRVIADYQTTIAWSIVASLSIIMSINAYDLAQSLSEGRR
ncbi:MAG: hypothetical protein K2J10_02175 [Muribaculaceae bacterium]|nr:hypothetical protein [Muribaculaceae bacterium]